jgi:N-acetyl sugar amidotransferase
MTANPIELKRPQGYQMCTMSVMDTTADPDIRFDAQGICNYFYEYQEKAKLRLFNDESNRSKLQEIISRIKADGEGKEYDCIIGVSGGVDSTYVAYLVKQLGLKPLAVHFDNGWNSELAVKNIEHVLTKLGIDLFTYVIDWEEFKSLQLGFLKASTPDGEIPTDHAITALLFQIANEKKVKYIINGNNFATESIMPISWSYGHIDWQYISWVNKNFGTRKLQSYPFITPLKYFYYTFVKGIKIISILNYLSYEKTEAMEVLQNELGWKYYGGKHYESIYTRFFQGYILPEKFGIDKRKAHLSSLIFSGQLTRADALEELKKPIYPQGLLDQDKTYVNKKFELTSAAFSEIMTLPRKTFRDYPNQFGLHMFLRKTLNTLRGKGLMYS